MKITELKSMSLIIVLAMMIMTAFTACSDDDNEGNKTVVFPELAKHQQRSRRNYRTIF